MQWHRTFQLANYITLFGIVPWINLFGRIRWKKYDMTISGTVVEVNTELEDDPDFVNDAPYTKGWIYKIKPDNIADIEKLLSSADYEAGL